MARPSAHRWGSNTPADDDEARERLLNAAEAAFAQHGVARATVDDVARAAKVHRTTVYKYFRGRNDLVVGVLLRETKEVFDDALRVLDDKPTFAEGIIEAIVRSSRAVYHSNYLRLMFSADNAGLTASIASASEAFASRASAALMPYLEAAAARGELRAGLALEDAAAWILRVNVSFVSVDEEHGPDESATRCYLETFLLPALVKDPPPPRPRQR